MKRTLMQLFLFLSLLCSYSFATDCFAWSITKRASTMEILPTLIYYDKVDWINLDATKTCSFKTFEAVMIKTYSSDISITYQ